MPPLERLLGLSVPPVAIAFTDAPPAGVPHASTVAPASCGYWKTAQAGSVFYTDAADHVRCPIGAHTHGAQLNVVQQQELQGLIGTMVQLEYLDMSEVPQIPHRAQPLRYAVYGPAGQLPVPADVVLVRGNAQQLMLLAEASQRAGVAGDAPMMGRPTCAVLAQATSSGKTAASFGCIGNRVYTGAGENDAWFAVPGDKLAAVEAKLAVIVRANQELEKFHRARV